jgi:hypothetical protein
VLPPGAHAMQEEDDVAHPDVPEEARHVTGCVGPALVKTLGLGSGQRLLCRLRYSFLSVARSTNGRPRLLLEMSMNMPRMTPPNGAATGTKHRTNRLHHSRGRRSRNWCASVPPKLWQTLVIGCPPLSDSCAPLGP